MPLDLMASGSLLWSTVVLQSTVDPLIDRFMVILIAENVRLSCLLYVNRSGARECPPVSTSRQRLVSRVCYSLLEPCYKDRCTVVYGF